MLAEYNVKSHVAWIALDWRSHCCQWLAIAITVGQVRDRLARPHCTIPQLCREREYNALLLYEEFAKIPITFHEAVV